MTPPDPPDDGPPDGPPDDEPTHAGVEPSVADFSEDEKTEAGTTVAPAAEPAPASEPVPDVTDEEEGEPAPEEGTISPYLTSILESLLFAADKPLGLKQLGDLVGATDLGPVRAAVADLETMYATRGIQLHQVAGGWQFRTNPANAAWVQKLLATKPVRLTRAQLETLAICAYRQPITRPEIDDIRGVDSGAALKTLMDRSLIRILGKKEEVGRPLLYGTTREFLDFFSLRDLKDLPTLREFHELTEEHRAQVAALEEKAPAGSVESVEEAAAAAAAEALRRPIERVTYQAPPEDADELAEIDRLIATAGGDKEVILDPAAAAGPAPPDTPQPEGE
jgi:segregation and condensation protein B